MVVPAKTRAAPGQPDISLQCSAHGAISKYSCTATANPFLDGLLLWRELGNTSLKVRPALTLSTGLSTSLSPELKRLRRRLIMAAPL